MTIGFTKQNFRDLLKSYDDTNNGGVLSRGDALIGRARVGKRFSDGDCALQDFERGSVKQKWKTSYFEDFPMPMPMLSPYLECRNNEAELVAEISMKMDFFNWKDDFGFEQ